MGLAKFEAMYENEDLARDILKAQKKLGILREQGYLLDTYPNEYRKPDSCYGAQMMTTGFKSKRGLMDCYFDDKFRRLFIGEGYADLLRQLRRERIAASRIMMKGKLFELAEGPKKSSTPGDYFGCFSGMIKAFDPRKRAPPSKRKEKMNFYTNCGKQGVGYGYNNIGLSKTTQYITEPFKSLKKESKQDEEKPFVSIAKCGTYFDDNPYELKKPIKYGTKRKYSVFKPVSQYAFCATSTPKKIGGNKSGCFHPFPKHLPDPYGIREKVKKEPVQMPTHPAKSLRVNPSIPYNINRTLNRDNHRTITGAMNLPRQEDYPVVYVCGQR